MPIKTCVGAVLYRDDYKIFLMTSPKWQGYLIPGGRIEAGETEEQALRREIWEELGIGISDVVKMGESVKPPSSDFNDPAIEFHFKTYYAKAASTEIRPNAELSSYGWYTLEEALQLPLLDSTRESVNQFKKLRERF